MVTATVIFLSAHNSTEVVDKYHHTGLPTPTPTVTEILSQIFMFVWQVLLAISPDLKPLHFIEEEAKAQRQRPGGCDKALAHGHLQEQQSLDFNCPSPRHRSSLCPCCVDREALSSHSAHSASRCSK